MGALRNHLSIECYCSEGQMKKIVDTISSHIHNSAPTDITDFDDVIGGVRVCVDFEPYFDKIELKASEILDKDWDLLYGDTAVLTSRLRPLIREYNREQKEIVDQSEDFFIGLYA